MSRKGATHSITLQVSEPVPPEVEAGSRVALNVNVSCARGCDLRGKQVQIVASDAVVASGELVRQDGPVNQTEPIAVTVPKEIGDYTWLVRFPSEPDAAIPHDEHSIPLSFRTIPHTLSLAVWDVPSPAALARPFQVKVGVRCSAACHLPGRVVEVVDEDGTRVAEGTLGDTPWPGTTGLYWAASEMPPPGGEGVFARSAVLAGGESELPHEGAPAAFSYRVDKAPVHAVVLTVIHEQSRAGVPDVEVRVGQYIASTDENGVARVTLPDGTFEVTIRKDGLQAAPVSLAVNGNLSVELEAAPAPTRAELDAKYFDDYPWG